MTLFTKAAFAASTMAMAARAVPQVTPVPLLPGCINYPSGGFYLEVNQCVDVETNEPCEAEGLRNNAQGDSYESGGYITIVPDENAPTVNLDCTFGSRGVTMLTANVTGDPYGVSLGMYDIEDNYQLAWQDGPIKLPETYVHTLEDGSTPDETFLGQQNVTTWAINQSESDSPEDPYTIRLMLDGELRPGESETFLKIVA